MSRELLREALGHLKTATIDANSYLVVTQQDVALFGYTIAAIESELSKPEQEPVAGAGGAWGEMAKKMSRDFVDRAKARQAPPPTNTITIGDLRKTDLYLRMATQSLREAFAPPREWVDLTDTDLMKEFGYTDELLRDTAYRVEQILKARNT